jgi:hypothetical protein
MNLTRQQADSRALLAGLPLSLELLLIGRQGG